MQKIDVEQIMDEIRVEIKEKGYREADLKFQDIPIPTMSGTDNGKFNPVELQNQVNACNKDWNNPMFFPVSGGNLIKEFYRKAMRRISKCVFWPIVDYQNKFNSDMVRVLNQVKYYIDADDMRYAAMKKQLLEDSREELKHLYEDHTAEKLGTISRQLMSVKWKQIDEAVKRDEKDTDMIRCNICGYHAQRGSFETKETKCIFNGGKLIRYVCPECGVIFGPTKFMNLSQQEIDEDYKVHYYGFSEGSSFDKEIEAFYMLNPDKNGIYLNYGCGCWSKSIQQLRADGYQVYGYEPYAPETDNPYMITSEAELVKMKFDGIYSNDLLEHLLDPIDALRFMKTLLMHPDSKMAHSTACYIYKYEYTRFHTHFFTGSSVEVMCKQAGLKIVDYRNAIEERDFICYVYMGENDRTDYKSCLYVSEHGERKDGTIILHAKGLMCGPCMVLGKGQYQMQCVTRLNGRKEILLRVASEKGKKELASICLEEGKNCFSFSLVQLEKDVEFVVSNDGTEDVIIEELTMF